MVFLVVQVAEVQTVEAEAVVPAEHSLALVAVVQVEEVVEPTTIGVGKQVALAEVQEVQVVMVLVQLV